MKKYITLATLLAAGSAFANADVTASFTSTSSGTSLSDIEITASGATVTLDSLLKSGSATSTNYSSDCSVRNEGVTAGFLAPNVNVANAGQWQLTLSFSDLADDFTLAGIKIETKGFNGSNAWQNSGNGATATGTTSSTTTPSNNASGKYVGFTVEYLLGNSSDWVNLGTYSIDVSGGSSSYGDDSTRYTTYSLETALAEVEATSVTVRISTSQDYTQGTFAGLGSVSLVAIPEPSTFGLLAGLGALALVGTRRRRR